MAVMCVGELMSMGIQPKFYNFGQPRVGDAAFVQWFDANFKGELARITHNRDPVVHLPLYDMGFRHAPVEYFYGELEGKYKQCSLTNGEDNKCSEGVLVTDIIDHVFYLDVNYNDIVFCQ